MKGGIGKIEMLKRTNILALVGGGENPCFSPRKIIIWDDHQANIVGIFILNKEILNIRIRNNKIFGICDDKIYIFNLNTFETIISLETYFNPTGIMAISSGDFNKLIIAYPVEHQGFINFRDCFYPKTIKNSKIIKAHENKVACLSINNNSSILASSSDNGTVIKLFSLNNGERFGVFKRGTTTVSMLCITFSLNSKFLGCISDVGTIHIFSLVDINKKLNENIDNEQIKKEMKNEIKEEENNEPKNSKSLFGKIGSLLNIKHHDRYFAKFHTPNGNSLICFGNENTIISINKEGKYIKGAFDPKEGGICQKIEEKNFLEDEN